MVDTDRHQRRGEFRREDREMSNYYCVITDYSGERATIVSSHRTEEAAERAQRRAKYGRVVTSPAEAGLPRPGERVWYRNGTSAISARAR